MRRLTLTFKTELWVNSSYVEMHCWDFSANKSRRQTVGEHSFNQCVNPDCLKTWDFQNSNPQLHPFPSSFSKVVLVFLHLCRSTAAAAAAWRHGLSPLTPGLGLKWACIWMAEHVHKHKHHSHYMDSGGECCSVCVISSTEKHHLLFRATQPHFAHFES